MSLRLSGEPSLQSNQRNTHALLTLEFEGLCSTIYVGSSDWSKDDRMSRVWTSLSSYSEKNFFVQWFVCTIAVLLLWIVHSLPCLDNCHILGWLFPLHSKSHTFAFHLMKSWQNLCNISGITFNIKQYMFFLLLFGNPWLIQFFFLNL